MEPAKEIVKNERFCTAFARGISDQLTTLPDEVSECARQVSLSTSLILTITLHLYKLLLMITSDLSASFAALADPTRRAILARLALGEATVAELTKPFEMTQPAISQHLKVLEEAGLIVTRIDGTKRPRRLAKAGIVAMDQWLTMLRKALEKNYARLDGVLADLESEKRKMR